MKNSKSLLLFLFLAMFSMFTFNGCTQKEAQKPKLFANDKEFSFAVGTEVHTYPNEPIEDPIEFSTRGPADVVAASAYLKNVAIATSGIVRIVDALKGKKLTTFQAWIIAAPILIGEIKPIIIAGKSLKGISEFYDATQGLTPDDRAQVANLFAAELDIPYAKAQEIIKLLAESAVVNTKLAEVIKEAVKK